jgi:hypothetical protein
MSTATFQTDNITFAIQSGIKDVLADDNIKKWIQENDLEPTNANSSPVTIKGEEGQTANLLHVKDSSDVELAKITAHGKIQSNRGFRGTANDWGDSFAGWAYGEFVAEHSGIIASYDYTGGVYERLLTATIPIFTQDDADNRNYIVLQNGDKKGAKSQIDEYISATQVTLLTDSWDEDLIAQTFSIYKSPVFISKIFSSYFYAKNGGSIFFENAGGDFIAHSIVEVVGDIGADNSDSFHIHHDAKGHNNSDAEQIFYKTGDLQEGDENQVLQINIDETEASGGKLQGIRIETTDVSTVSKCAIKVGVGFDCAFNMDGGVAIDMDYGYEISGVTVADRVNGVAGDGNAFLEAGNDLTLFDSNNDYILIGNDDQFEILSFITDTSSSQNLVFEFYYSKAGGNWTLFAPGDGTEGGTKSGLIVFDAPADWTKDDQAEVNGDITNAYYIKIKRTRIGNPPVALIEDYFKIYLERAGDTGMRIKGDGRVKLPYLAGAPASLENGDTWMENDGLHIYWNGVEKLVAGV